MINQARENLVAALPYARRFARALTGNQTAGDALVATAVKAVVASPDLAALPPRAALYRVISQEFGRGTTASSGGMPFEQRALLLLTSLEELPLQAAALVMDIDETRAATMVTKAREGLKEIAQTSVLIIEDEPIIALDIQDLVERCGHRIAGVAHTERDAVELATQTRPGLILADINLGSGGDGMQAVGRILKHHTAPVIFVTAYPERLLTGEAHEPSFVITKPFEPMTLAVATYQAVTGGMSEI